MWIPPTPFQLVLSLLTFRGAAFTFSNLIYNIILKLAVVLAKASSSQNFNSW